MKKIALLLITVFFNTLIHSQCDKKATLTICDISKIDYNKDDLKLDGLINLYDQYTKLTGNTIKKGTWTEVRAYNYSLQDSNKGIVNIWNLKSSTVSDQTKYQYILYNDQCGKDKPALTITVEIGAFSGLANIIKKNEDVNLRVCYTKEMQFCDPPFFNLNEALNPEPAPLKNGTWEYLGTRKDVSVSGSKAYLRVLYVPGGSLTDQETFDFRYTVKSNLSCKPEMITDVKISVVRGISAGYGYKTLICEDEIIGGKYKNNINLRDDKYLLHEDKEGYWNHKIKSLKPAEAEINIQDLYTKIKKEEPRFGFKKISYTYNVDDRSNLCGNDSAIVEFIIVEKLRPFKVSAENQNLAFCVDGEKIKQKINLYEKLEFTEENGIKYEYNKSKTNYWSLNPILEGEDLALFLRHNPQWIYDKTNKRIICKLPKIDLDLSYMSSKQIGTYSFTYFVPATYNYKGGLEYDPLKPPKKPKRKPGEPCFELEAPQLCNKNAEQATININVNGKPYAGEDTIIDLCESAFSPTIDLFTILKTDKNKTVKKDGTWTNIDTKKSISNILSIPEFKNSITLNLKYEVKISDDCTDNSNLTLTIYKSNTSGKGGTIEVCSNESAFNLFDRLEGNPSKNGKWILPDKTESSNHILNINPQEIKTGKYIYRINDVVDNNGKVICEKNQTEITLKLIETYAGEDTVINLCGEEINKGINLNDFLSGAKKQKISHGGKWTIADSNTNISNIFQTKISTDKTFNFIYTTKNSKCEDSSKLTIKTFKAITPGIGSSQSFCKTQTDEINLFDYLTENPSRDGFWILPDNSRTKNYNLKIVPNSAIEGTYKYQTPSIKDNKGNEICPSKSSEITISIIEKPNAGEDVEVKVCTNNGAIDLFSLLKNQNNNNGLFFDENNKLINSRFNPENSPNKTTITYKIEDGVCVGDESKITLVFEEPKAPVSSNQFFCAAKEFPRIKDLVVSGASNYQWYESENSIIELSDDTILKNGANYFVATTDIENGCTSKRTKISVFYKTLGDNCQPCINNGISDNDDNINEYLELCNLPDLFPNFKLEIYNRLGVLIYKGDKNSEPFSGKGNVSGTETSKLPTGVYFYIFSPNDNKTKPFQNNFYLGR